MCDCQEEFEEEEVVEQLTVTVPLTVKRKKGQ